MKVLLLMLLLAGLIGCSSPAASSKKVFDLKTAADNAYDAKRCDEAIRHYKKLLKKAPGYLEAWLRIGNCHARNDRVSEAVAAYRSAVTQDPSYTKAWYNLAYMQAQELGKTVVQMQKNIDPSDPSVKRMRELTIDILAPFNLIVETPVESVEKEAVKSLVGETE